MDNWKGIRELWPSCPVHLECLESRTMIRPNMAACRRITRELYGGPLFLKAHS